MDDITTLAEIKKLMGKLVNPESCDKLTRMAESLKEVMTNTPIRKGDVVYLNNNCSSLLRPYIGKPFTVNAVSKEGMIKITIDNIEGVVSRDKVVLQSEKFPDALTSSGAEFGIE